jgi:hypothetical protein
LPDNTRTQHKLDAGINLGRAVLELLPTVHTRLRNDQQFVMSTFAGVASDLCGFFLASSRPNEALEYLEQGRGVIISQLLDRQGRGSVKGGRGRGLSRKEKRRVLMIPFLAVAGLCQTNLGEISVQNRPTEGLRRVGGSEPGWQARCPSTQQDYI